MLVNRSMCTPLHVHVMSCSIITWAAGPAGELNPSRVSVSGDGGGSPSLGAELQRVSCHSNVSTSTCMCTHQKKIIEVD